LVGDQWKNGASMKKTRAHQRTGKARHRRAVFAWISQSVALNGELYSAASVSGTTKVLTEARFQGKVDTPRV